MKYSILIFLLFFFVGLSAFPVNAQSASPAVNSQSGICNPLIPALCGSANAPIRFGSLVSSLFGALLIIAGLFFLINLLTGGITWITSGGDKAALDNARTQIQNAVMGMFITAATWVIYILVTQFLGLTPIGSSTIQFHLPPLFGQ